MFGIPYFPQFLLRPYTLVKTHAIEDADLCDRFAHGKESLRPIVFNHGLGAHLSFYTTIYYALASHGFLVIALNHQDESCFFTVDKDDKDIAHEITKSDLAYYSGQVKQRVEEIHLTIDSLKELSPALHFWIFGGFAPNAKIDMSELILAGHSYGAISMIAAAAKLSDAA